MAIVNLTPHVLNIHSGVHVRDGGVFLERVIAVPPSGTVARVSTTRVQAGMVEGVETFRVEFGTVVDLPAPQDGVIYVVSGMVASAAPREDVFSPGELVRNEAGQPIGCCGLTRSI